MSKEWNNEELINIIRKGFKAVEELDIVRHGYREMKRKSQLVLHAVKQGNLSNYSDVQQRKIKEKAIRILKTINYREQKDFEKLLKNDEYIYLIKAKEIGFDNIFNIYSNMTSELQEYNVNIPIDKLKKIAMEYISKLVSMKKQGEDARQQLVTANMPMIEDVVRNVAAERYDMIDDLKSIALEQFMICADKTFDISKGHKFSTYVYTCMVSKCKLEKMQHDDIIAIASSKMSEKARFYRDELDMEASEIENEEKRKEEVAIRQTIKNTSQYVSLDYVASREDELSAPKEYLIADEDSKMNYITDDLLTEQVMQQVYNKIKNNKDKKQQMIAAKVEAWRLRNSINTDDKDIYTLSEIAEKLYEDGFTERLYTVERVRQMANDGGDYVRKSLDKNMLEELQKVSEQM